MKVAILISGEWRTNDTCISGRNKSKSEINVNILKMINKLENLGHSVDIFIATNDLHMSDTNKKFGKRIKNMYLDNVKYFMHEPENKQELTNIKPYLHKYHEIAKITSNTHLEQFNNKNFQIFHYNKVIYQFLKLYIAFNMALKYSRENNFEYDLLFRIRPDTLIHFTFDNVLLNKIYSEEFIIAHSDLFAVSNLRLMTIYCNFVNSYGSHYDYFKNLNDSNVERWAFAPEVQMFSIYDSITKKTFFDLFKREFKGVGVILNVSIIR